jgi:hypothetical protein
VNSAKVLTAVPKRLWVTTAIATLIGIMYVLVTYGQDDERMLIFSAITERSGMAFTFFAVPIAIVASLMRFDLREAAMVVGVPIFAAIVTLVVIASEGRFTSMLYDLAAGDVTNAFWQYPPIWKIVLVAAVASCAAWFVTNELRDNLTDFFRPFRWRG